MFQTPKLIGHRGVCGYAPKNLFRSALIVLGLIAIVALGIVLRGEYQDFARDTHYKKQIATLLDLSGAKDITNDPQRQFDHVRAFINDHSTHNIDQEFYSMWRDQTKLAAIVIDHAQGKRKEIPHLECSTRSGLVIAMLKQLGYQARTIVVYNIDDHLLSHTFLEVLNPLTQQWEVQDPDYDIYWRNTATLQRVSVAEIIADPTAQEPCQRDHCGWDTQSQQGAKASGFKNYLRMASIVDKPKKYRVTFYHDSVEPNAHYVYEGQEGTFCDLIGKNCRQGFVPVSKILEEKKISHAP